MELPGVNGIVVGGHPGEADLARLERRANELGLGPRVAFTGMVRPREVAARLEPADVLVLPNPATAASERYTSPLKLFEYLALGRPIVASDLPAFREVVRHRENALLFEAGSAPALAAAVRARDRRPGTRPVDGPAGVRDGARLLVGRPRRAPGCICSARPPVGGPGERSEDDRVVISERLLSIARCPDCGGEAGWRWRRGRGVPGLRAVVRRLGRLSRPAAEGGLWRADALSRRGAPRRRATRARLAAAAGVGRPPRDAARVPAAGAGRPRHRPGLRQRADAGLEPGRRGVPGGRRRQPVLRERSAGGRGSRARRSPAAAVRRRRVHQGVRPGRVRAPVARGRSPASCAKRPACWPRAGSCSSTVTCGRTRAWRSACASSTGLPGCSIARAPST